MDDHRMRYEAGHAFFPALADRMHLTAAIAKCAGSCARAEAFVKNTLALLRGDERLPVPSRMITFLLGDLPFSWQDRF